MRDYPTKGYDMATDKYFTSVPYKAEILVVAESHKVIEMQNNGYPKTVAEVDGGVLLKLTVTADSLEELTAKVAAVMGAAL